MPFTLDEGIINIITTTVNTQWGLRQTSYIHHESVNKALNFMGIRQLRDDEYCMLPTRLYNTLPSYFT